LEYVAQGKVSASQLVNHEQPLSDLPKVLYDLAHRRNGQIKTAIIP
jgi:threonine dehydrogenase-like Zn-dependent dehydrogenase